MDLKIGNTTVKISEYDYIIIAVILLITAYLGYIKYNQNAVRSTIVATQEQMDSVISQTNELIRIKEGQEHMIFQCKIDSLSNGNKIGGLVETQKGLIRELNIKRENNQNTLTVMNRLIDNNTELEAEIFQDLSNANAFHIEGDRAESFTKQKIDSINLLANEDAAAQMALDNFGETNPAITLLEIKPVTTVGSNVSVNRATQTKFFRVLAKVENTVCREKVCHISFKGPDGVDVAIENGVPGGDKDSHPTRELTLPRQGERVFYVPVLNVRLKGIYRGIIEYKTEPIDPKCIATVNIPI